MPLKIASFNCTLGLVNKIEVIKLILNEKNLDVLFLQEVEIKPTTPLNHLKIENYNLELSPTFDQLNSRTCCYVSSKLKYKRLTNHENNKVELIAIETMNNVLCGLYRPFLLPNHISEMEYIKDVLGVLNEACHPNMIIIGDFNIDLSKTNLQNYKYANIYNELESYFIENTFVQLIKKTTWQRKYKDTLKESILDHIYTNNLCNVISNFNEQQTIGDHNLIGLELKIETVNYPHNYPKIVQDWSKYSKEALIEKLSTIDFSELELLEVDSHVSELNQILGTVLDELVTTIHVKRKEVPGFISIGYIKKRRNEEKLLQEI